MLLCSQTLHFVFWYLIFDFVCHTWCVLVFSFWDSFCFCPMISRFWTMLVLSLANIKEQQPGWGDDLSPDFCRTKKISSWLTSLDLCRQTARGWPHYLQTSALDLAFNACGGGTGSGLACLCSSVCPWIMSRNPSSTSPHGACPQIPTSGRAVSHCVVRALLVGAHRCECHDG